MPRACVVITGPTASGKTGVAIAVARALGTEIVSFDSRQLYKEMRIGTAQPTPDELAAVPHHFIGSHSIHQPLNASAYADAAVPVVENIIAKYGIAVAVGGSGLYLKALAGALDEIPARDMQIREQLQQLWVQEGIVALQQQLKQLDPVYFDEVDKQNPHRLIRALEVCLSSGKPYSQFRQGTGVQRSFTLHYYGIDLPRQNLYSRINERVEKMIDEGLEEEAKALQPFRGLAPLETVGYREWFDYFEGHTSREEAIRRIQRNSRRYAKRQLTWFRKYDTMQWHPPDKVVDSLLKQWK